MTTTTKDEEAAVEAARLVAIEERRKSLAERAARKGSALHEAESLKERVRRMDEDRKRYLREFDDTKEAIAKERGRSIAIIQDAAQAEDDLDREFVPLELKQAADRAGVATRAAAVKVEDARGRLRQARQNFDVLTSKADPDTKKQRGLAAKDVETCEGLLAEREVFLKDLQEREARAVAELEASRAKARS